MNEAAPDSELIPARHSQINWQIPRSLRGVEFRAGQKSFPVSPDAQVKC